MDAFLVLFVIISLLTLGGLSYFSNSRGKVNRLFASMALWAAIWAASNFLESEVRNPTIASFLLRLDFASAALLAYFFLLFCVNFPNPSPRWKNKEYIVLIPAVFLAVISFSPLIVKDIGAYRGGLQLQFGRGNLFWIYGLCLFGYMALGCTSLVIKWRKFSGIPKVQVSYVLLGLSLSAFPALFINLVLSQIIELSLTISRLGIYGILFFAVLTTYAVVTYRLMNINVAITRGTLFTGVYIFVLGIPVGVGLWGQSYLSREIGVNWWLVPLGIMLILSSLGPTFYAALRKRAESERRRYQEKLIALAKQMTLTKNLGSLLVLIIRRVTKEMGISYARIYLLDRKTNEYVREVRYGKERRRQFGDSISKDSPLIRILSRSRDVGPLLKEEVISHFETNETQHLKEVKAQLRSMGAAILLPAFIGEELVAFLVLGTKRSKEIYTSDDLSMFKILAGQAALAIENAQFYQELKEAQATMLQAAKLSSIGELAAGFAHQIDNPLGIISAGCQLCMMDIKERLGRGNLTEEDKKLFGDMEDRMQKVIDTAHRGADLVQRIKGYAKPSDRDFEATDLNSVAEDALVLAQYQISHGGVSVNKDIPQDLPKIKGIGVQLEQAFLNMIINACEAMAGKKGELTISAKVGQENPDKVEITISDNGCGIPKENLRRLFDLFYTTKGSQGTGVGLSIAYQIIKDHNGAVNVESELGKGTKFTVCLPIWEEKT
ncbi:GAF domain-containing protein [bacterium]|nr:GAF domain-containing protein [bacterium]